MGAEGFVSGSGQWPIHEQARNPGEGRETIALSTYTSPSAGVGWAKTGMGEEKPASGFFYWQNTVMNSSHVGVGASGPAPSTAQRFV